MLIHRWRLALAAGALVILGAIGGGLVQAAIPSSGSATDRAASAASADPGLLDDIVLAADPSAGPTAAPGSGPDRAQKLRDRLAARAGGLRKRIVHGTVSMVGAGGNLISVQLDHGTVSAVGSGSITVAEAGGGKVTVATDAATRVRKDRKLVTLTDLKTGDEVLVQSTVDGGVATAKRIVVPPNAPAAPASTSPSG